MAFEEAKDRFFRYLLGTPFRAVLTSLGILAILITQGELLANPFFLWAFIFLLFIAIFNIPWIGEKYDLYKCHDEVVKYIKRFNVDRSQPIYDIVHKALIPQGIKGENSKGESVYFLFYRLPRVVGPLKTVVFAVNTISGKFEYWDDKIFFPTFLHENLKVLQKRGLFKAGKDDVTAFIPNLGDEMIGSLD